MIDLMSAPGFTGFFITVVSAILLSVLICAIADGGRPVAKPKKPKQGKLGIRND